VRFQQVAPGSLGHVVISRLSTRLPSSAYIGPTACQLPVLCQH
jgi:hypothetical protein